jgi:hypothetical protein
MAQINEDEYNQLVSNLENELVEVLTEDVQEPELDLEGIDPVLLEEAIWNFQVDEDINEFERLYESKYEILKELDVKNIGIYNVLVVDSGRNAWYATWSRKFKREKAFFLDLDSAKKYAETNRKQGTVFTIVPTPSLFFELHGIYIFLMDIATREPFSRWKLKKFDFGKKDVFLQDLYEEFRLTSLNWDSPVPDDDNFDISMVITEENIKQNEVKNLNCYKSESVGTDFYLKWREVDPEYDNSSITKIVKILKTSLVKKGTRKGTN